MSALFPNPCCRCGYCCLHEACPVAQEVFGITKDDPCPALRYEGGAVCLLALEEPEIMGVGVGCCMKATCYRDGVAYDFAALSPELKKHVAAMKAREKLAALG
jgi:hypothetical protein